MPHNLIHVNFARGEKSDLLKHSAFAKSIPVRLWICLQVPQAAVRIGWGAGYRHSQAEIIEPLFGNKISQPCDCTQADFLNPLMAELTGGCLGNRTRKVFTVIYRLPCLLSSFILRTMWSRRFSLLSSQLRLLRLRKLKAFACGTCKCWSRHVNSVRLWGLRWIHCAVPPGITVVCAWEGQVLALRVRSYTW